MKKLLKKDIKRLEDWYGNHTKAAKHIGITPRYYRMIRQGKVVPGKFLMMRFEQILEHMDWFEANPTVPTSHLAVGYTETIVSRRNNLN